jgi:hypothetical protein
MRRLQAGADALSVLLEAALECVALAERIDQ